MSQSNHNINNANTLNQVFSNLNSFLIEHLKHSIVVIVQLDEKRDAGYVKSIGGINKPIFNKLIRILGLNPVGKYFKNTTFGRKHIYSSRHFKQFPSNLYELSGKLFPEWLFKTIENLFNFDNIYYKGLTCDNQAMGAVVVFTRENEDYKLSALEIEVDRYALKMKEILDDYNSEILGIGIKERFTHALLANINHEIRTPLNGIIGLLDAGLKLLNENENTRELTHTIWQNSIDLTNKLDSLLLISEFEAKSVSLKLRMQTIESLIIQLNNVIRGIGNEYKSREISLFYNASVNLGLTTYIDLYYFDFTIRELLRNAIKFSEEKIDIKLKRLKMQL